jgi:hypothetical protein
LGVIDRLILFGRFVKAATDPITKATTADDVLDKDGNVIKEGTGDLSAIQEILIGETRPPQTR